MQGSKTAIPRCKAPNTYDSKYAPNPRPQGDVDAVNYVRGQAYFMRAFYYFQLENLFGEDNVPNPSAKDYPGGTHCNGQGHHDRHYAAGKGQRQIGVGADRK